MGTSGRWVLVGVQLALSPVQGLVMGGDAGRACVMVMFGWRPGSVWSRSANDERFEK